MKIFDYFYENYLQDILTVVREFGLFMANAFLILILLVSTPLWIIPYMTWKMRQEKKESEVKNED